MWDKAIEVRFRATDTAVASMWAPLLGFASAGLAVTDAASNATSARESSSSPPQPVSSDGAAPNGSNIPSSSDGLSSGALAGIIVGAVLALLLIIGALVFFLRRRKRKQDSPPPFEGEVGQKPELDSKVLHPSELVGHNDRAEVEVPAGELEGDTSRLTELESLVESAEARS
jgi:hypothetical protein